MTGVLVFLLVAALLIGAFYWTGRGSRGAAGPGALQAPPANLFSVSGRKRPDAAPAVAPRAATRQPPAARGAATSAAAGGRGRNPDAPCWICSRSLADGHKH